MPEISDNIIIGKNYIRYNDVDLKISNISRTWVFRFRNHEKAAKEQEKRRFQDGKERAEKNESIKKRANVKACVTISIIFFIISLIACIATMLVGKEPLLKELTNMFAESIPFPIGSTSLPIGILTLPIGIISFIISGMLALAAYKIHNKVFIYNFTPPLDIDYPDKYGLGIEMTSGYKVYFTAERNEGYLALRKLQDDINNADTQHGITVFNMQDNSITVENNDGIINTGDTVDNYVGAKYV